MSGATHAIPTTWNGIIGRWIASVSEDARRAYRRALSTFTTWAMPDATDPHQGLQLLCGAGAGGAHELLAGWRDHLLELGRAPGTVAGQVSAIASLLRCCRRAGLVAFQVDGIAPRRERAKDRRVPARAEVERLLAHVDELAAAGDRRAIRDAAVLRCLYCAEMKRGDITKMTLASWSRMRLPNTTAAAISAWLAVRGVKPGAMFYRLDRDSERKHLTGESIRASLEQWCKGAGIQTVNPQALVVSARAELEQIRLDLMNV